MGEASEQNATTDGVIVIDHLVKTFGSVRAVDDLSFTVHPGRVTGFLGLSHPSDAAGERPAGDALLVLPTRR
jgi:ABC-type uncharacterized transport system ATPase subunit